MEVKIYVYKHRLEGIDKETFKQCLKDTIQYWLIKPYYYVIRVKPFKSFDFSKAVPVEIDLDWDFAEAWDKTPQEDKRRFFSLIDEELPIFIYFATKGGKQS